MAILNSRVPMGIKSAAVSLVAVVIMLVSSASGWVSAADIPTAPRPDPSGDATVRGETANYGAITIHGPADQSVFPPDIAPPTFQWSDPISCYWSIHIQFADRTIPPDIKTSTNRWTPTLKEWELIKQQSVEKPAQITILGFASDRSERAHACGKMSFSTSKDEVGAPIFYREVNLPFVEAARDPAQLRWRLGSVSSPDPPPVVLEKMPVCGNCHSFSREGGFLAMDVDHPDKSSYLISRLKPETVLAQEDIVAWNDYRKEDRESTMGLLAQISPDGRFAISTVREKCVLTADGLAFSQHLLPVQGVLAVYRRDTREFQPLPGADDPEFVQTNPVWSPGGEFVVFARATAYHPSQPLRKGSVIIPTYYCQELVNGDKAFRFDLYRVPFNEGRGGKPEPLAGASRNGRSNYFPKYSPDGKWMVFCQANSGMLLQPDSELYIVSAQGGEARRLAANTASMNSWHSWSPNGKWLVFASKAHSPFTQLCLTHIDDRGNSSPAILLERFSAPGKAANIPEFVPPSAGAISNLLARFALDKSRVNEGHARFKLGDYDGAIGEYRQALAVNPRNLEARQSLGLLLFHVKKAHAEGMAELAEAVRLAPRNPYINYDNGIVMLHEGQTDTAVKHFKDAMEYATNGVDDQYDPYSPQYKMGMLLSPRHAKNRFLRPLAEMQYHLGLALFLQGDFAASAEVLARTALVEAANDADVLHQLALSLAAQLKWNEARPYYLKALKIKPGIESVDRLANYPGLTPRAVKSFGETLAAARRMLAPPVSASLPQASKY